MIAHQVNSDLEFSPMFDSMWSIYQDDGFGNAVYCFYYISGLSDFIEEDLH